jgi:threonine dehydrogenase-like Zn-dependent dehydrogenase
MNGLVFHGVRDVRAETVADPRIVEPTDAIVRVERTAVCGSDLHVWHGRERGLDAGTVLGHELVGRVLETGRDVRTLRPGIRVVSPFTTSCGSCFYCRAGLTARCTRSQIFGWIESGHGLQGAQAELVRVPLADSTLVAIPDSIPLEAALLLADVLPTGWYCAERGGVASGVTCAVVGCGPVGLMAVVAARAQGAGTVWAIDVVPERLAQAERFGAVPLSATNDDAASVVRDATEGRGVDAVLEAVGTEASHRVALDLARPGGTISVVGVHTEASFPFTPADLYARNLTYRVGRCPARSLIDPLLSWLEAGSVDVGAVFTHRMPLASGPAAYRMFDAKADGCIKVALEP